MNSKISSFKHFWAVTSATLARLSHTHTITPAQTWEFFAAENFSSHQQFHFQMQFSPLYLGAAYSRRYPGCGQMCTAALSGVLIGHSTRLTIKFVIFRCSRAERTRADKMADSSVHSPH